MYHCCLLSRCVFRFLSRPSRGSTEERKGAGEGQVAAFRPDVAYNLLHTLFYGLLAFSTMRWDLVILASSTCRCLNSQTSPSSRILRRGLSKCTFPLDELIMQSREQMLKSKCLLNASHKVSEWSALALISPQRQAPSSATHSRRKKSRYSWTIDN